MPDAFVLSRSDVEKIRADHRRLKALTKGGRRRRNDRTAWPVNEWLGILDEDLNQGSVATVSIWDGEPGAEADTGRDVEAWDWMLVGSGDVIETGTHVVVRRFPNGAFYVVAAGCSAP